MDSGKMVGRERYIPIFKQTEKSLMRSATLPPEEREKAFDTDTFRRLMLKDWELGLVVTGNAFDLYFLDLEEGKIITLPDLEEEGK